MRCVVTRSTFVAGQLFAASPTPVELPEATAKTLIGLGKAEAVAEAAQAVEPVVKTPGETPKATKRGQKAQAVEPVVETPVETVLAETP